MLRDTSMANTRSRSTCSAAHANGFSVRPSAHSGSTHRKFLMTVGFPEEVCDKTENITGGPREQEQVGAPGQNRPPALQQGHPLTRMQAVVVTFFESCQRDMP